MPMLAFRKCSFAGDDERRRHRLITCSATDSGSRGDRICDRMIVNSSPPRRVTVSVSRTHCFSRSAVWRSTSSPAAWPTLSLMFLKLSRSTNSSANCCGSRCAWAKRRASWSLKYRRFGSAGQRVVVRLVVELLVLGRGREGDADAVAEVPCPCPLLVGQDRAATKAQDDHADDGVLPDDRQHEQRAAPSFATGAKIAA